MVETLTKMKLSICTFASCFYMKSKRATAQNMLSKVLFLVEGGRAYSAFVKARAASHHSMTRPEVELRTSHDASDWPRIARTSKLRAG